MRKRLLSTLILVLAFASSLSAGQGDGWVKLEPPGGGFSIMMPGKVDEDLQPGDDFTLHAYSASTASGIYMAGYGDYAARIRLDPAGELAANRDNFLKGLEAKLIDTKNISLDGHQGIEFTGESRIARFSSRVYIIGNRVYQLTTAIDIDKDDAANVNRFFASFTFTKADAEHKP